MSFSSYGSHLMHDYFFCLFQAFIHQRRSKSTWYLFYFVFANCNNAIFYKLVQKKEIKNLVIMLYQLSYFDESKGGFEPPTLMPQAKKERFYRPFMS